MKIFEAFAEMLGNTEYKSRAEAKKAKRAEATNSVAQQPSLHARMSHELFMQQIGGASQFGPKHKRY